MNNSQKLCALCYLAAKNNTNRKSSVLNDDDFLFDVGVDDMNNYDSN